MATATSPDADDVGAVGGVVIIADPELTMSPTEENVVGVGEDVVVRV